VLSLFSRRKRRPAPRWPYSARLEVERLEGRDSPSSLDPASFLTPPPPDPSANMTTSVPAQTDPLSGSGSAAATSPTSDPTANPSPAPDTSNTAPSATPSPAATPAPSATPAPATVSPSGAAGGSAAPATTSAPATPAPVAGDTVPPGTPPAPVPTPPAPGLATPSITGVTEEAEWNYTVSGTVSDPNPASLQIEITVDQTAEPAVAVNADGTFSTTFTLPPCTSATNSTRFCTAVATNGTQTSAPADFTIEQTPRPPANP